MTSVSRKKEIKKCIDIDIDIDIVNTTRARARTTNDGVILIVANTISIAATHYTKIIEHEIKFCKCCTRYRVLYLMTTVLNKSSIRRSTLAS